MSDENKKTMPRGSFDLIGEALKLFKERWKKYVVIQLIPWIVGAGLFVVMILFAVIVFLRGRELMHETAAVVLLILLGLVALVVVLGLIVVGVWASYTLMLAVVDYKKDRTWKEYYKESRKIIWGLILVSLLLLLVNFVGFLLLVIPMFIFGVWFSFSVWVYFDKGKGSGIVNALRESYRLVKGFFWSIVWRNLVFGLAVGLIYIAIGLLCIPLFIIIALVGIDPDVLQPFGRLIESAIGLVITPITLLFSYLLYRNIKELKDKGIKKHKLALWIKILVPVLIVLMILIPVLIGVLIMNKLDKEEPRKVFGDSFELMIDNLEKGSDLEQVKLLLEEYKEENGVYPVSFDQLGRGEEDIFINSSTGLKYSYSVWAGNLKYEICTELEGEDGDEEYCVGSEDIE